MLQEMNKAVVAQGEANAEAANADKAMAEGNSFSVLKPSRVQYLKLGSQM